MLTGVPGLPIPRLLVIYDFFVFFFYNPTDRPNIRKRIKQGRGDGLSRNNQVTLVSSPDWILLGRNIQKHVLDSVVVYLTVKKAGKEKELEATGVKLKRTKHRKTLFVISRRTNIWCFCWWLRPGSSLLHCSMLDLSKLTEKRIKVVTEFLSERTR